MATLRKRAQCECTRFLRFSERLKGLEGSVAVAQKDDKAIAFRTRESSHASKSMGKGT